MDNFFNDIYVIFENVFCYWGGGNKLVVLRNFIFRVVIKELMLINGFVGCGKFFLLVVIFGEFFLIEGYILCVGKIMYVF